MTCRKGNAELTAVNKKGGKFDVTTKDKLTNEISAFCKYEGGRNDGAGYCAGVDYADGDTRANFKYNFVTRCP